MKTFFTHKSGISCDDSLAKTKPFEVYAVKRSQIITSCEQWVKDALRSLPVPLNQNASLAEEQTYYIEDLLRRFTSAHSKIVLYKKVNNMSVR